jgi:hypothetical protein
MMTENQWLTSTDPADMLRHIRRCRGERLRLQHPAWFARCKKDLAPRKLRLFLLACCYRVCRGCSDSSCDQVLQLAERHVESPPPPTNRDNILRHLLEGLPAGQALSGTASAVLSALRQPLALAAADLRVFVGRRAGKVTADKSARTPAQNAAMQAEARAQCDLLRDIFGNPFLPVKIERDWLAWNGATIRKLAQSIYEDRAFDCLPVLADALEDAGCDNAAILNHCRNGGPHVRGCWLVDLLLGKT